MTSEKRKHCFELMRHPLNRRFFEGIIIMLKDDGVYGWPYMQEVFTKEEIRKALEDNSSTGAEERPSTE